MHECFRGRGGWLGSCLLAWLGVSPSYSLTNPPPAVIDLKSVLPTRWLGLEIGMRSWHNRAGRNTVSRREKGQGGDL
ncbi:hypothetical protein I7I50_01758 [Histoplasma capsulatum G186AR]|uniref:Secreted protein n=1 Tax=Ajellomyces capsulatus TaxID=5037 RepID=A0A8H8CSQ3_AJECA|nr:hypothetical protein I7I52_11972 [Histoplasma capsulatum]QSS71045.1 hypothetical protein I7I50_01758 [Histoplasma capsulatum G186AR]